MAQGRGFAVIDLETTGFSGKDRIIEVGVVLLDTTLAVEGMWDTLVQPNRDIPNTFVHGISATDVVGAPTFADVAPKLAHLMNRRTPVAHNASFERRFLAQEFRRAGVATTIDSVEWVDTMVLSKRAFGCAKLEDALVAAGITNDRPHAALADAEATAALLAALVSKRGVKMSAGPGFAAEPVGDVAVEARSRTAGPRPARHWLAGLAGKLPRGGDADTERYRRALAASLVDRELSASEIAQLGQIAVNDGLSLDDVALIHEEFVRQMAVTAWLDGVVTGQERAELTELARQLGVAEEVVDTLLASPVHGEAAEEFTLRPGDRVAFTGALDLPRSAWEERAAAYGLASGPVTTKTTVVVAANPDTTSGKAARARELLIPVVSEVAFTRLVAALEAVDAGAVGGEAAGSEGVDTRRFPWLPESEPGPISPDDVAAAWIFTHADAPLHRLSPGLSAGHEVEMGHSSVATAGQRWKQHYPQMLEATVLDLRSIPGVGEKRLKRMVESVVLAALDADDPAPQAEAETADAPDTAGVVAGWAALTGKPFPGTTRETMTDLFAACVAELTSVASRDERTLAIATQRWIGGATLDQLGAQLGVTRERVRQLEKTAREAFSVGCRLSEATARYLADRFGPLTPAERARAELPELWARDAALGATYEEYFRAMFGLWELNGEWIQAPGWNSKVAGWLDGGVDAHGTFTLADASAQLAVPAEDLRAWFLADPAVFPVSEAALARATSHQDRAVAVLAAAGSPMRIEDIASRFPTQPSVRSMANQLAVDDRITRVAPNTYALAEWGLEEFFTIADWIARRIDASPTGAVALSALLKEAPSLGVAESSVRAYASGAGFALSDGVVRRSAGADEVIEDTPTDSKNMYVRDGEWHMLLTVNAEHLRGSGFPVPRGAVGLYRVPVGGEVEVPSRLGGQFMRVNKLRQPSTSTIRRFLEGLGSAEGDRVWLTFAPKRFDVTPAPAPDPRLDGLARLLDEMGLNPLLASDADAAMGEVNAALGLDRNAPRRRSAAIFGHRGQDDLADIIRAL